MSCVLEFGVRGGAHTDNIVCPTVKLGARIARDLVRVLRTDDGVAIELVVPKNHFNVSRKNPRATWQSSTHFVSVSLLDDVPRGSASSKLWKV